MTTLINSLKAEIARVARKELKDELLTIRKTTSAHRSEIATLKRQVKTLTSELKAHKRTVKSAGTPASMVGEAAPTPRGFRYNSERFAALRAKLGLTQAEMAKLIGASSLSVHKWEKGPVQPRAAQLARIAAVMKLGKREATEKLNT